MPYWHEPDSDGSPSTSTWLSDRECEERSCEGKVKNKARDVAYLIKQMDHDLDVLQVQLGTCLGHSEVESAHDR
eukprot:12908746-Prorocentrum_lima.AAC.1